MFRTRTVEIDGSPAERDPGWLDVCDVLLAWRFFTALDCCHKRIKERRFVTFDRKVEPTRVLTCLGRGTGVDSAPNATDGAACSRQATAQSPNNVRSVNSTFLARAIGGR